MDLFFDSLPLLIALPLVYLGLWLRDRLRRRGRGRTPILIDGSNVMHWRDNTPSLEPVIEIVALLKAAGFRPGVIFDANAGYKLEGRYRDDAVFACRLGLPAAQVLVVPKGQPADPTLLAVARDLEARIISNDRFRDWEAEHPELRLPGRVIRGGYRNGALWLDLD
ncbi:NYN domain-containing protein [Rhodobacter lacus]|uniref:RNase NYN domain-containing protein n=1 Tax=Rhodobacter lacus TaxID=1641972 RepID=A0ABW5A9M6_9RHOB